MNRRLTSLGIGLAAAVSLFAARSAQAQQATVVTGVPAPPAAETAQTVPNRPMLLTGAGVFLVGYVPSFIVAATSDHKGDDNLYIPVVGPWIDLGERGCSGIETQRCGTTTWEGIGLVADGIVQGMGTIGMIASLFVPERTRVARAAPQQKVVVAPTSMRGRGFGLAAAGTF